MKWRFVKPPMQASGDLVSAGVTGASFQPLKIGGGGWLTGLDVNADGTLLARTDTFGLYVGSTTPGTVWRQAMNVNSMPAGKAGFDGSGNWIFGGSIGGVYSSRIAPSNSSIMYHAGPSDVFKSTNKGVTWTATSFPATGDFGASANDGSRIFQQKMTIHPTDPNTVLVGTPNSGLYYTQDGGSSWHSIATVPASTGAGAGFGISGIVFDPATPTTIYAASNGNGVYKTTTGVTGTWSLVSGSPKIVCHAVMTAGNYFAAGDATSLVAGAGSRVFKYNGSTWATLLVGDANGIQGVVVNPANAAMLIATETSGEMWASIDSGATWNNRDANPGPDHNWTFDTTGDVAWLATTSKTFFSAGGLVFDPTVSNRVWQSFGVGVGYITHVDWNLTFDSPLTMKFQTAGIEQLVARQIISPPGGVPIIAVEDRSEFRIVDPEVYPSDYSTSALTGTTCAGWMVDFVKGDPAKLVAVNNYQAAGLSMKSTDGGVSWSVFGSEPTTNVGGQIAVGSSLNSIIASHGNFPTQILFTTNGGTSWTAGSGLPTTGWPGPLFDNFKSMCSDAAGTFYIFNVNNDSSGGVYSSPTGATWTQKLSGVPWTGSSAAILTCPWNKTGHLFLARGPVGGAHPTTDHLGFSKDSGVTWNNVGNLVDVWAVGFGAVAAGQSYPTIWVVGFATIAGTPTYGIHVCKNFDPNTPSAATWTMLEDYPFNSTDQIVNITGDSNDASKCYFGFQGSGAGYGKNLVY